MRIIVDCDNTISKTDKAVLRVYQEMTGDTSTTEKNLTDYKLNTICPLWTPEQVSNVFINQRLFEVMEVIPKSIEVLEKLSKNHEIIIATVHNPKGIQMKSDWIKARFPFVSSVIYIDNGIIMDKSIITGDVIIDDHIDNLKSANCPQKICFGDYVYNQDWAGDRVTSWEEIEKKFEPVKSKVKK